MQIFIMGIDKCITMQTRRDATIRVDFVLFAGEIILVRCGLSSKFFGHLLLLDDARITATRNRNSSDLESSVFLNARMSTKKAKCLYHTFAGNSTPFITKSQNFQN